MRRLLSCLLFRLQHGRWPRTFDTEAWAIIDEGIRFGFIRGPALRKLLEEDV